MQINPLTKPITDPKSKTTLYIIGTIILVLILIGAGFWYWSRKRVGAPETPAAAEVKDGLGAEALKKTINPLSNKLPETNPFQVNTNPFK